MKEIDRSLKLKTEMLIDDIREYSQNPHDEYVRLAAIVRQLEKRKNKVMEGINHANKQA